MNCESFQSMATSWRLSLSRGRWKTEIAQRCVCEREKNCSRSQRDTQRTLSRSFFLDSSFSCSERYSIYAGRRLAYALVLTVTDASLLVTSSLRTAIIFRVKCDELNGEINAQLVECTAKFAPRETEKVSQQACSDEHVTNSINCIKTFPIKFGSLPSQSRASVVKHFPTQLTQFGQSSAVSRFAQSHRTLIRCFCVWGNP